MVLCNVGQFDNSYFHHWADDFEVVTESWREDIFAVIQGVKRPATADINKAKACTVGTSGLERTAGAKITFTEAGWDKANTVKLYLALGEDGRAPAGLTRKIKSQALPVATSSGTGWFYTTNINIQAKRSFVWQ